MGALRDRAVEAMATAIHAGEDELVEPCDQCEQMAGAAYDALVADLGLREEQAGQILVPGFLSATRSRLIGDWQEAPDA